MNKNDIAERLQSKRRRTGVSQFKLAKAIGVSYSLVQKAESGANLSKESVEKFEAWLRGGK